MRQGGKIPAMQVPMLSFGFIDSINSEAYQEALNQYGGNARENLDILRNGRGSNSFLSVLLNSCKGILPEGESVASLAQFGQAFNSSPKFFRGTYQDTGIILRTNGDSISRNNYLAKNLFGKLKKRGFVATAENPVVVSLSDLTLIQNKNLGYGLVYGLKDGAQPIQGENVAQSFGSKAEIDKFTIYDLQGIPISDKDGEFRIWKKNDGVSRVYSGSDQYADSNFGHLADSVDYGRVVVSTLDSAEGVAKNYVEIEKVIKAEEQRRIDWKEDLEKKIANL